MMEDFVSKLDSKIDGVKRLGREYYKVDKELGLLVDKVDLRPESVGVFLGEERKKKFFPSIALLELVSKDSDKKLFVNDKAEWLFLCGRDLMSKSILKSNVNNGLVLVQNENNENLGLGRIFGRTDENTDRIAVKNILDRGDFLRREK